MTDKKADTWMPLWIGAYLADTMKLTTLQHGAYFLLLIAYWRERKPLADIDDELRSITKLERSDWKRVKPVVAQFFKVRDGAWWHKRVEEEIAAADARAKKAAEKASKAAQARWGDGNKQTSSNAPSMQQALHEDVHDECPPPTPISSSPSVKKKKTAPPSPAVSDLVAAGFDEQTATEFIAHKAAFKAPLTERAWNDHVREAQKAGWTPADAAVKVMAKSWKGFEAKYVANERPQSAPAETAYARSMREKYENVTPMVAAAKPGAVRQMNPMEVLDGLTRITG